MNDQQLLRYSRQILLKEIGIEGQQKILDSKVLLIGMGGLGSPATLYLAAAGVGKLTLVDHDQVDLTNLQRQIIHSTSSINEPKVKSAQQRALEINPEIEIRTIHQKLDEDALNQQITAHDLILDCSDNFATRFLINKLCVGLQKPLISGAAIRMEGQVTTFDFRKAGAACYRCLYDESGEEEDTCSTTGVLSPIVGIIGSIQATEAIKLLVDLPTLSGRLLIMDALLMQWRTLNLKQDPFCPICSCKHPHIAGSGRYV